MTLILLHPFQKKNSIITSEFLNFTISSIECYQLVLLEGTFEEKLTTCYSFKKKKLWFIFKTVSLVKLLTVNHRYRGNAATYLPNNESHFECTLKNNHFMLLTSVPYIKKSEVKAQHVILPWLPLSGKSLVSLSSAASSASPSICQRETI